ncbi:YxeA family protein [Paenibacillus lautus]|uniref:YxeA family protein n=1 Tax=Paenibacillus lautus TaxID=1401 RepID=UPI003D2765BB
MIFMSTVPLTSNHLTSRNIYYTIVDRAFHSIGNNDSYIYVMVGYTKEGKAKELSFSTSKPIPNGAYLRLYVSIIRGVTYWEEVTVDEMPFLTKTLLIQKAADLIPDQRLRNLPILLPLHKQQRSDFLIPT